MLIGSDHDAGMVSSVLSHHWAIYFIRHFYMAQLFTKIPKCLIPLHQRSTNIPRPHLSGFRALVGCLVVRIVRIVSRDIRPAQGRRHQHGRDGNRHSFFLGALDVLETGDTKYTIQSIVCEDSCHPIIQFALGHSITWSLCHSVTKSLSHYFQHYY